VTALFLTIKATGKELDVTREQYETCEDVTERVRLAGLIDERPHAISYLNRGRARADWDTGQVRKQLHILDTEVDKLRALVADAPAKLVMLEKRILFFRRKMEGEIGRQEASKLSTLTAFQNAQERLQVLVGGG